MTAKPGEVPEVQLAGGPACWRSSEIAPHQYMYELSGSDLGEIDTALRYVVSHAVYPAQIAREQFPLERLRVSLDAIGHQLESGIGFCLLRGFPVERYSVAEAGTVLCGIGSYFGRTMAQNSRGEVLNHVRAAPLPAGREAHGRGYQTASALPFHSDSCDVVGLLCIRDAKRGGLSAIASSYAVHNAMFIRRPDLLSLLYQPLAIDRHGETARAGPPYYSTPVFMRHNGRLFSRFNPGYVFSAQRYPEAARLTEAQIEAIEAFNRLCASDQFRLDMRLRPGDLQLLNNNVLVHARTSYEDYPEAARKRHLLRMWLFTSALAQLPVPMRDRYLDMEAWHVNANLPDPPECD
jgi:hypothetical protein